MEGVCILPSFFLRRRVCKSPSERVCVLQATMPDEADGRPRRGDSACVRARDGTGVSFGGLRLGRSMVVEFWHRKCERCPDALQSLQALVDEGAVPDNVLVAACALSTAATGDEEERRRVIELLALEEDDGGAFPGLTHLFMTFDQKEVAKREWGFSRVPHCVVLGRTGQVLASAPPHDASVRAALRVVGVGPVESSSCARTSHDAALL